MENGPIQYLSTNSVTVKQSNEMLTTGIYNFSLGERETNNHTRHEKANNAAEMTQGQEIDKDRRTDGRTYRVHGGEPPIQLENDLRL